MLSLLSLIGLAAAAKPAVLDLWRGYPGADKVYVEVGVPDGGTALFLVDTGASISVVNDHLAERLGLQPQVDGGMVAGLSGSVPWQRATLGFVDLAGARVENVDVAVGVPGVPEVAGVLPVDGILGHNVWSKFTLVVDYPADRLELHQPGTYKARGKGQLMDVRQGRAVVDVGIDAERDGKQIAAVVSIEVDTGAADTSLWCMTGEPFRGITSLGVEPVVGIGASLDKVPDFQFLTETRRVPATRVTVGGRTIRREASMRWNSPDNPAADACAVSRGLLGYQTVSDFRLVLDYQAGRLVLEPKRTRRKFDAYAAWLQRDAALPGAGTPERAADRARVLDASGKGEEARKLVLDALAQAPDDAELVAIAARIDRYDGRDEEALARLSALAPAALVEQGAWGEMIGLLRATGRSDEALQRAQAAVAQPVDDPQVRQELLVALSDALLAADRAAEAESALDEAIAVDRGGSGFLFRKALLALDLGDRHGAMATLRTLMDLYPIGGQAMWLYALTAAPTDHATLRADLARALGRLHPGTEPLDFVGAAWLVVGERDRGLSTLAAGQARDCGPLRRGPARDNCDAWYWALSGERLDEAAAAISRAVAARPRESALRDTAAVVAHRRGDHAEALAQAREAARLSPDDPYLIWQARRFTAAASEHTP